ncbi:MAG: NAD+ synthase [Dehalococcoidia bacterium]|jgi:NAD+ synthase (glutamine-hydrolysing)|nr:NAD+ synthase [Dehalococcoidia bacterium]
MAVLRVALAQMNPTVGDLEGNARKVIHYVQEARRLGADVVAFPELAIPGYPPEDLVLRLSFVRDNVRALLDVVSACRGITAVVGFIDQPSARGELDDDVYNAAAIIHDGRLAGVYHKQRLPNYGVFDEVRYFQAGKECPVFTLGPVGIGVNICEDIWYPGDPTRTQALAGAQVIININGSPYHMGKRYVREQMIATRASDYAVALCYVNMVGGQDELVFDGGSMVVDAQGHLLARASLFEEELLVCDIDVGDVMRLRLRDPRRRMERWQYQATAPVIPLAPAPAGQPRPPLTPRIAPPLALEEEVYKALVVGTRDYVRKTGFQDVLVAMSGGIDSSLVTCIAVDALGPQHVMGISMPSRYSSEASVADARQLAQNLGIRFLIIPIEPAHQAYLDMLAEPFAGTPPGVAEENIQARIRGNIVMALSNKFGALVLTCGNKSEMATGYATLYGDMAGGFAVIKDVPKTLVYRLARYRNSISPVIPENVFLKPPSAELRPGQTDQDTLPPYEVLDPILQAYVEEEKSPQEIMAMGFEPEIVAKVIHMVDRNEYKRRQAPPGVKITPRAFGRDWRLPIANRYRVL